MMDLRIITTVLLLPMYECSPISRNSSINSPTVFTIYNSTDRWWLKPDQWHNKRVLTRRQDYNVNVILISFDIGITALAVAHAVAEQDKFPQLNPTLAYYHTSAYRWILRQLSLYPDILYKKFYETHKVWRRRFYYENYFVPDWIRRALVWVDDTTWDHEEDMFYKFHEYPKRIFDKYDRYPPARFVSQESWSKDRSIFYPGRFADYDKV